MTTMNSLFIPGAIELVILLAIILFLFPSIIIYVAKKAGMSFERIRHVDDDARKGLEETEER